MPVQIFHELDHHKYLANDFYSEAHLISESNGDIIAVVIPGGYKKWKSFAVVANDDKVSDIHLKIF